MATKINFTNPNFGNLKVHVKHAKDSGLPFVEQGMHTDEPGAVLCSTGPSICDPEVQSEVKRLVEQEGYTPIFLKESITYLKEVIGVTAKYAVAMDPGSERQIARTPLDPDVTYCAATSVHPEYLDYISENANVLLFHSACGVYDMKSMPGVCLELHTEQNCVIQSEDSHTLKTNDGFEFTPIMYAQVMEDDFYTKLFGKVIPVMTGGFTVSNRALALIKYMGFKNIVMAGTDFGWRADHNKGSHYADFVKVSPEDPSAMTDKGLVDGTLWHTRLDQLASAVDLAWKIKDGGVVVLGDSLASAIAKREDEFVKNLVSIKFRP